MCSRSPRLPRKMALLSGELAGNGIILRNVRGRIKDVTDLAFFRPNTWGGVGGGEEGAPGRVPSVGAFSLFTFAAPIETLCHISRLEK